MALFVRDKMFYKSFFSLMIIITLQNLIIFSVNLADNVMLGIYDETALSGANLALQIQFILHLIIIGIAEGVVILTSRYWGQGRVEPIRQVVNIGMRCAVVVAVIVWALAFCMPHRLLSVFTYEQDIIAAGAVYMRIACFTYLTFAVTVMLMSVLRGVETVAIGFVMSLTTLIVNVFLNYVLIYGNLGAPELGIKGAGYATVIARVLEMGIIIAYVRCFDKKIGLKLHDFCSRLEPKLLKTYLKVTAPIVGGEALWAFGSAAQTAILGHLGAAAIAANSIITAVNQIVGVGIIGSVSATVVVLGKTLGEGGLERFKAYAKTLQVIYLIIGIITALILYLLKDFIIDFYNISPEARMLTLQFMAVLCVTLVGTAYEFSVIAGIIRGGGDTTFMFINDFVFMWLVVVPSGYIAAFVLNWPPVVVFMCIRYDQLVKCVVAFIKVNRFRFIKKITV